ncbi:thioredoxin family protein [Tateyamaria omphalii]|uniref:Thioredoxin family protein n=1 Tax=Tateyamaria omphalii TaxID=299262 RepID=A0A1P8MTL6_9RHOB|nr:thioredoxin family protein [Tateyamaria omphalii]APX11384.1 thioredoxin family protein [Tateyamaria omphalii]
MLLETPGCDFGDAAPPFRLPDAHGQMHDLNDLLGRNGILVAFICNHCPYVVAIADRLAMDAKTLQAEGIGVVAINANDYVAYPADAPDRMPGFAAKHGFDFPYLIDEDQSVARAYGAVCTPDFFGFSADGLLQYRGRLDDVRMGDAKDRTPDLLNAMRHIAETGVGPRDQTPSMGCSIKWR